MYDFSWLYRPGRCNVADPLSRLPVHGACESTMLAALRVMTRGQSRAKESTQGPAKETAKQPVQQPEQSRQTAQSDTDMVDAVQIMALLLAMQTRK